LWRRVVLTEISDVLTASIIKAVMALSTSETLASFYDITLWYLRSLISETSVIFAIVT
jgi:hypothetical protein